MLDLEDFIAALRKALMARREKAVAILIAAEAAHHDLVRGQVNAFDVALADLVDMERKFLGRDDEDAPVRAPIKINTGAKQPASYGRARA
jgi:hypothetical protein